jgi:hypothetical protein
MIEAPRREYRDADEPVIAAIPDHHEFRHRHFGHVELGEAQLPPKHFRGAEHGRGEIDAVGFDTPIDDRPSARIAGDGETELQIGHACCPLTGLWWSIPGSSHHIIHSRRAPGIGRAGEKETVL